MLLLRVKHGNLQTAIRIKLEWFTDIREEAFLGKSYSENTSVSPFPAASTGLPKGVITQQAELVYIP